jgi:hypothetical protein
MLFNVKIHSKLDLKSFVLPWQLPSITGSVSIYICLRYHLRTWGVFALVTPSGSREPARCQLTYFPVPQVLLAVLPTLVKLSAWNGYRCIHSDGELKTFYTMSCRHENDTLGPNAPLLTLDEPAPHDRGENRTSYQSSNYSVSLFIWALTFSAGISGLLFGYEYGKASFNTLRPSAILQC